MGRQFLWSGGACGFAGQVRTKPVFVDADVDEEVADLRVGVVAAAGQRVGEHCGEATVLIEPEKS